MYVCINMADMKTKENESLFKPDSMTVMKTKVYIYIYNPHVIVCMFATIEMYFITNLQQIYNEFELIDVKVSKVSKVSQVPKVRHGKIILHL